MLYFIVIITNCSSIGDDGGISSISGNSNFSVKLRIYHLMEFIL